MDKRLTYLLLLIFLPLLSSSLVNCSGNPYQPTSLTDSSLRSDGQALPLILPAGELPPLPASNGAQTKRTTGTPVGYLGNDDIYAISEGATIGEDTIRFQPGHMETQYAIYAYTPDDYWVDCVYYGSYSDEPPPFYFFYSNYSENNWKPADCERSSSNSAMKGCWRSFENTPVNPACEIWSAK